MSPADLLWKPWDETNFQNPYPMYNRLRETDPVHLAQTGEWIITRYEDVRSILKDPRFIVGNRLEWLKRGVAYLDNKDLEFQSIVDAMNSFMLFLNPPQHTRIRKFITTVWNDYTIEHRLKEIIDKLIGQLPINRFDLVGDFAQQVPVLTMMHILGIPEKDYKELKKSALDLIKALDLYITAEHLVTIHHASKDFIDYFRKLIRQKDFSEDGLIHKIYQANKSLAEPLSENELISICIFLFTAGEETTSSLIGTGTLNLLSHTEQLNHVRQSSVDWDAAVDELLRFDPPVQLLGRIANEDIELDGKKIKKGSTTTLCLGGANRDPLIFKDPDSLNLSSQQNRHLAFGSGIHFCLGDWLGKLSGKMAIKKIFETYPEIRIESTSLKWNKNLAIRSLSTLSVLVD